MVTLYWALKYVWATSKTPPVPYYEIRLTHPLWNTIPSWKVIAVLYKAQKNYYFHTENVCEQIVARGLNGLSRLFQAHPKSNLHPICIALNPPPEVAWKWIQARCYWHSWFMWDYTYHKSVELDYGMLVASLWQACDKCEGIFWITTFCSSLLPMLGKKEAFLVSLLTVFWWLRRVVQHHKRKLWWFNCATYSIRCKTAASASGTNTRTAF